MWAILLPLILEFLGKLLDALLRDLFEKAKSELGEYPLSHAVAIEQAFDAAAAQTSWWQFGRRRLLAACRRACLKNTAAFAAAVRGEASCPVMGVSEAAEIARAM
jgi:hypothetical protein